MPGYTLIICGCDLKWTHITATKCSRQRVISNGFESSRWIKMILFYHYIYQVFKKFGPHFRKLKEKIIAGKVSDFGQIKDLPMHNIKHCSPVLLLEPLFQCNILRQL